METIYQHDITFDELTRLNKMIPGRRIDDEKEYNNNFDIDIKYADLFRLYYIRKEIKTAESYLNKIKDPVLKVLLQ
jgi:hypothetical protein